MPDTSCLVALVCGWHQDNADAIAEIGRRLDAKESMVLAGHALAETFAVLTRLPLPHRLAPSAAAELIDVNLIAQAQSVDALAGTEYAELVRTAPLRGIAGSRIYDALIAATAARVGARALLTFNDRHFRGLLPADVQIVVPSRRSA